MPLATVQFAHELQATWLKSALLPFLLTVKESLASSPAPRETRSAARKRNIDQVAESEGGEDATRGSPDSSRPEISADAEKKPPAQNTKGRKRARNSVSANINASQKKDLQGRIRDVEDEKKALQSRLTKLETSLKNVTKESVLNARKGTKGVWDQAKIDTEFKNLKRDIKSWVKKYGTTKKISTFSDGNKKDILSACTLDHYQDVFSKDDFATIQELPMGARLLLEGFLYAHSIRCLIGRPFIFIDAVLQEHSRPNKAIVGVGNYEQLFEDFADSLAECKVFPDQAQRWTASMLQSLKRMIIPDPPDDIASHLRDEKVSSDPYCIYELGISQFTSDFLHHDKPARHLLGDVQNKDHKLRHEDLKKIHRKFRELAYHLWCQPSAVFFDYKLDQFEPESMELDPSAIHEDQETETKRLKGNKVLINLSPMIWGEIIDSDDGKERKKVVYLTRKVWTVDCQTRGQWKASQKESSSWDIQNTEHTSSGSVIQNATQEVAGSTSVDDGTVGSPQAQESKDTDNTMLSPPDANSDNGPDLPEVQATQPSTAGAEIAHSAGSPDTGDAEDHDDLVKMEES